MGTMRGIKVGGVNQEVCVNCSGSRDLSNLCLRLHSQSLDGFFPTDGFKGSKGHVTLFLSLAFLSSSTTCGRDDVGAKPQGHIMDSPGSVFGTAQQLSHIMIPSIFGVVFPHTVPLWFVCFGVGVVLYYISRVEKYIIGFHIVILP